MKKEISVNEIKGITIGQVENKEAATGCTVFISKEGMRAGLDIRGGGPASRETQLLNPLMAAEVIHSIVLAGGSAFGLEAGSGVMNYLEEKNIGLDVGITKVPLVVQSDIFDLGVGDPKVRPDREMGYRAAKQALEDPNHRDGNYGVGIGATVGKIGGKNTCMKSGIGSYALQIGDLQAGAVVVVNAVGDVFDWKCGKEIAGLLTEDKKNLRRSSDIMLERGVPEAGSLVTNTTLAVFMTNAKFTKAELCKIAGMAHDGYARSIQPVHTSNDGDSIYAVSLGDLEVNRDLIGTLASEIISEAIIRAVKNADPAYGITSFKDLQK